jgi:DNA-binding response OmpR family regulator
VRILLLEDEPDIAQGMVEVLTRDRYAVDWVASVDAALAAIAERDVDLAVFDVMVGDDDDAGFSLAATLRDAGFLGPILFTTARDTVADRVRGLDLGGDDYLVKPYSLVELRARVRALLRREAQVKRSETVLGPLRVDLANRRVWWVEREVELSDREFAILELLALHPQRVFATLELLERFFPDAASGPQVVRVYVRQLRQKVDESVIATVAGGYRLGVG